MLDIFSALLLSALAVALAVLGIGAVSEKSKKAESMSSEVNANDVTEGVAECITYNDVEKENKPDSAPLVDESHGKNSETLGDDFNTALKIYALSRAANRPNITIDEINDYIRSNRRLTEKLNLFDNYFFNASGVDEAWIKANLEHPYFEIDASDYGKISSSAYDESSFYRSFGKRPERVLKAFNEGLTSGQTEKVFMSKEGRICHAITYPTSGNIDAVAVIDTRIKELPGFKDEELEVTFKGVVPREYIKRIFMSRSMYEDIISKIHGKNYDDVEATCDIKNGYFEKGKPALIPVDGNGNRKEYDVNLLMKIAEFNYSERSLKNNQHEIPVISNECAPSINYDMKHDADNVTMDEKNIYSTIKKHIARLGRKIHQFL